MATKKGANKGCAPSNLIPHPSPFEHPLKKLYAPSMGGENEDHITGNRLKISPSGAIGAVITLSAFAWLALRMPIFNHALADIAFYEGLLIAAALIMVYLPKYIHKKLPREILYFADERPKKTLLIAPIASFVLAVFFMLWVTDWAENLADKISADQSSNNKNQKISD